MGLGSTHCQVLGEPVHAWGSIASDLMKTHKFSPRASLSLRNISSVIVLQTEFFLIERSIVHLPARSCSTRYPYSSLYPTVPTASPASMGDSEGPLACTTESGKIWYQVGVISWGRSCGQNTPGIYTLLENFSLWIKKVTELEGRPFNAEKMRAPTNQKPPCSLASEFLEPGSPSFWLLPCLLSSLLF
ncbi:hypothetical protein MC885_001335 [Smutsia gigantea]|nr:hypothetical protein MC885_001335 [Smutsia gigantea]